MIAMRRLLPLLAIPIFLFPTGCGAPKQAATGKADNAPPAPIAAVSEDLSSPQVLIPKGSATPLPPEIKQVDVVRDGWQVLLPKLVNGEKLKEFEMSDSEGRSVEVVQKRFAASWNTLFELENKGIVSGVFSGTLRISGAIEFSANDIPFAYSFGVEHVRIMEDGSVEGECCGPMLTMIRDSDGDGKFETPENGIGQVPDWVLKRVNSEKKREK